MPISKTLTPNEINLIGNGIQNCGASCFFNSAIQMLFHIPEFREFIIAHKYLFINNNIIFNLIQLFKKMKEGKKIDTEDNITSSKTLRQLYDDIQLNYFNSGNSQQDAGELLMYLINGSLNNNEDSITKSLNNQVIINNKNINDDKYFQEYNINLPLYDFIIKSKTNKKCINNKPLIKNDEIVTYSAFITSEFINNKNLSLQDTNSVLENVKDQCIGSDFMNETIRYFPKKYVIIQVRREYYDKVNKITKINYEPITNYNKDLSINDTNGNRYNLIGTICKAGEPGGGHWWYHHKINNIWYEYNDSSTTPNSEPSSDSIIYALFRKDNAKYSYVVYNTINSLIHTIFTNAVIYINNYDVKKSTKIKEYINILAYYTNVYNKGLKSEYNSQLVRIRTYFITKIKALLLTI